MPTPNDAATPPAHSLEPPRALHLAKEVEGSADARRAVRRARLIAVGHPSVTDPTDHPTPHDSWTSPARPPSPTCP